MPNSSECCQAFSTNNRRTHPHSSLLVRSSRPPAFSTLVYPNCSNVSFAFPARRPDLQNTITGAAGPSSSSKCIERGGGRNNNNKRMRGDAVRFEGGPNTERENFIAYIYAPYHFCPAGARRPSPSTPNNRRGCSSRAGTVWTLAAPPSPRRRCERRGITRPARRPRS